MTEPTYDSLLAQRESLDRQIAQAKRAERSAMIRRILESMAAYSISVGELAIAARGKHRKQAEVRYRDPDSGATWSGRGKPPVDRGQRPRRVQDLTLTHFSQGPQLSHDHESTEGRYAGNHRVGGEPAGSIWRGGNQRANTPRSRWRASLFRPGGRRNLRNAAAQRRRVGREWRG
jgi:DNA-binding protein H-NS